LVKILHLGLFYVRKYAPRRWTETSAAHHPNSQVINQPTAVAFGTMTLAYFSPVRTTTSMLRPVTDYWGLEI